MTDNTKPKWIESLRLVTPILAIFLTFYIQTINKNLDMLSVDVKDMRVEISHHLQNSDLHIPRATVVSRDEFELYQRMRDKQMNDIKDSLYEVKCILGEGVRRK